MRIHASFGGSEPTQEDIEVYHVHLGDRSGSMLGAKWNAVKEGIIEDISSTQRISEKEGLSVNYSVITFSGPYDYKDLLFARKSPIGHLQFPNAGGGTALCDAIVETVRRLRAIKRPQDKVLLKIYTDGEERDSINYDKHNVADLIEVTKREGFTVAFAGTEADVRTAIKDYKIEKTNTIVHDNTMRGINAAFAATHDASVKYAKKLKNKEDVSMDFFDQKAK